MSTGPANTPMAKVEQVTQVVFRAIDAINQGRPHDRRIAKSPDTVLLGEAGGLDSLGLVNLIVAVEEEIDEEFGVTINIADEKARAQVNSPLKTVGSLADYIAALLTEKRNG